jgi:hypothetical protein
MWYHRYLQHPGHTRLEETMKAAIYWKGMRNTIQSKTKSWKTCQVNKKRTQKYGHLPPKIVISTPWEALCVNLLPTIMRLMTKKVNGKERTIKEEIFDKSSD